MKILITGVSGFIGFSLAEKLLKENFIVYGIDNFDDYYSVKLKKKRISILQQNKAQNIEKSPGDVGMSLSPNALVQKSSIA